MIKCIAIIDTSLENRYAAESAIVDLFSWASVPHFSSFRQFESEFRKDPHCFDLVLSEMQLEDNLSGLDVATLSWTWNVPATIISTIKNFYGQERVVLGYPRNEFPGNKKDPDVWRNVITKILSRGDFNNMITEALRLGKNAEPDHEIGRLRAIEVIVPQKH